MKIKDFNIDMTGSEMYFWEQIDTLKEKLRRAKLPWYKRIFA